MGPGGITDIDVSDQIKGVLAGLEEGRISEPFTQGPSTLWLHVVSLQRPPARGLAQAGAAAGDQDSSVFQQIVPEHIARASYGAQAG